MSLMVRIPCLKRIRGKASRTGLDEVGHLDTAVGASAGRGRGFSRRLIQHWVFWPNTMNARLSKSLTQNELSDFSPSWHNRCANQRRGHKMMSWTETTRLKYRRKGLRYSSDMLGAEWELIGAVCRRAPAVGAAASDGAARGGRGYLLHRGDGLPVADAAEGVPTLFDSAAILVPLARHRHLGADQSYAADAGARGGGTRSRPVGRGDRQPIGQDHRGGRPARVRRR